MGLVIGTTGVGMIIHGASEWSNDIAAIIANIVLIGIGIYAIYIYWNWLLGD
ncbi:hypothetical protein GCM10028868_39150 [Virgibacillus kimchii]